MENRAAIDRTRRWISDFVIGLNLCPFARRPFDAELIRYTVTAAADEPALLESLTEELPILAAAPRTAIETAFLIHPHALADYLDYNDFLATADQLLKRLGLWGTIQIVGFHPDYRFAGADPDAVENFTNRSPYPMLHLLREQSVSEVANDPKRLHEIPRRNSETLRSLGREEIRKRLAQLTADASPR